MALAVVMAMMGIMTAEKAQGEAHSKALLAETTTLLAGYVTRLDGRAARAADN